MNKRNVKTLIFLVCLTILPFAFYFSMYEGSALLEDQFEWKNSAKVSASAGEVTKTGDINQVDFFIYAAKFRPFFPIVTTICAAVIALWVIDRFLKARAHMIGNGIVGFASIIGGLYLISGVTEGSSYFSIVLLLLGAAALLLAFRSFRSGHSRSILNHS
ncbi:DUF4306 domain-containing protein [Rossellomorea marisflavi]|uniref:DUF4306 domain-containing protein n=1 Tax=Rossellomorea TaxID=2837508 RepID=UPI00064E9E9B|nr:DUF4306 domain-containing protein [Rossellomorea marisflavi]KMK91640.1 hypothetical protein VL03_19340 [Rossellomorea marisflavi]KML00881.1 hypothetical protein VL06_20470 [Rossellomorea marisflavi]UTE72768.1 YjdJ family protein [Rossellomorea marisflavi]